MCNAGGDKADEKEAAKQGSKAGLSARYAASDKTASNFHEFAQL